MRIGFYAGKIQPKSLGGGATFQMNIIEGLLNADTEHEFFIYYKSNKDLFSGTDKVKFINLKHEYQVKVLYELTPKNKRKRYTILNRLVIRDNIELVYFITPEYQMTYAPFIYTIWDLGHRSDSYFPEVSIRNAYESREEFYLNVVPKASYVVIGNNTGKREVCKYYGAEEHRVKTIAMPTPTYIYESKPDDSILEKFNLEPQKYLFYPAQFWPHKNHIRLVKAMKKLKEQGLDFKMVFTGSDVGNKNYIIQKVKEYNLENEVLFLGFVSKEEIISLYKNAYALTYASIMGPDNIPPLEAMALRCPAIIAGTVGMREQLGDCALFFDPLDENSIVEQVEKLKDDNVKNQLLDKGEILAKNCCTENYLAGMLKLIDEFAPIRECWSSTEKYIHL